MESLELSIVVPREFYHRAGPNPGVGLLVRDWLFERSQNREAASQLASFVVGLGRRWCAVVDVVVVGPPSHRRRRSELSESGRKATGERVDTHSVGADVYTSGERLAHLPAEGGVPSSVATDSFEEGECETR